MSDQVLVDAAEYAELQRIAELRSSRLLDAAREVQELRAKVADAEAAWHRGMTLGDTQYIVNDDTIDLAMTDIWDALHGPQASDSGTGS